MWASIRSSSIWATHGLRPTEALQLADSQRNLTRYQGVLTFSEEEAGKSICEAFLPAFFCQELEIIVPGL